MFLMLSVRLAAAAHAYLNVYAPTNILIRTLRDPGRYRLAFTVSAALVVSYGLLGAWLTSIIDSGGPGWLNLLALLCAWNTIKFSWVAVLAVLHKVCCTSDGVTTRVATDPAEAQFSSGVADSVLCQAASEWLMSGTEERSLEVEGRQDRYVD